MVDMIFTEKSYHGFPILTYNITGKMETEAIDIFADIRVYLQLRQFYEDTATSDPHNDMFEFQIEFYRNRIIARIADYVHRRGTPITEERPKVSFSETCHTIQ